MAYTSTGTSVTKKVAKLAELVGCVDFNTEVDSDPFLAEPTRGSVVVLAFGTGQLELHATAKMSAISAIRGDDLQSVSARHAPVHSRWYC
jgi:hypothetical protein